MWNFSGAYGAHLMRQYGYHRDGFSIQGDEFYFVAFATTMHQHHRANIASFQVMFWEVFRQYNGFKFVNHCRCSQSGFASSTNISWIKPSIQLT